MLECTDLTEEGASRQEEPVMSEADLLDSIQQTMLQINRELEDEDNMVSHWWYNSDLLHVKIGGYLASDGTMSILFTIIIPSCSIPCEPQQEILSGSIPSS